MVVKSKIARLSQKRRVTTRANLPKAAPTNTDPLPPPLPTAAPPSSKAVVRHTAFAARMQDACKRHPYAPDLHQGLLNWMVTELSKRFNVNVSKETARKWIAGEVMPRRDRINAVADLLQVHPGWLSVGDDHDQNLAPRERKVRNAMADGAVNTVAGLIQMDGGHIAFPEPGDSRAEKDSISLYAIIKGANYALHVTLAEPSDAGLRFRAPIEYDRVIVLGVVREGFSIKVFEIQPEVIQGNTARRGGSIEVLVEDDSLLRRIESFTQRL